MGTQGCKFGRFIYETSATKQKLSGPISGYFDTLLAFLKENIAALEQKSICCSEPPEALARLVVSQIPGEYILSRIYQNDGLLQGGLLTLRKVLGLTVEDCSTASDMEPGVG